MRRKAEEEKTKLSLRKKELSDDKWKRENREQGRVDKEHEWKGGIDR